MENIPPQELLNFWKKGKTLYAALYEFAAPEILQEYSDLELKLRNHSPNRGSIKISDLPTISSSLADFSSLLLLQSEIEIVRDKLKWDLLDKILSEKLIGIGYEAPIKSSDNPKIIPLHIWPQKIKEINWEDYSILKNGVQFLNIRLIKKSATKKAISPPINSVPKFQIKDKKTGRPSKVDKIISAYEYLNKGGQIDYSKTLKSHTEAIQETVRFLFPEIKGTAGMGHEVIRRALMPRFEAEKKTSKPTSKL